ncbi:MAG: ureidoglycolate lyase, partial [Pseudomonadales bacterium]
NLRAFIAMAHQGVNYHKGTWHHYCLGLNIGNDFLVVDRGGEGDNCDEVEIPSDINIIVNH